MRLLGTANAKTSKGEKLGYLTGILYLAAHTQSGKYNVCPMASEGCSDACLFTAGYGKFDNVRNARIRKTIRFFEDRAAFMADIVSDIEAVIRKADREDLTPCIRLNGTSDIRWETVECERDGVVYPNVMAAFPDIQFYDYTKLPNRRNIPANYHLTFSRSESNDAHLYEAFSNGMNIAVVFDTKKSAALPARWAPVPEDGATHRLGSLPVIDGDLSDVRFEDPKGCIVGLRAKGDAKGDGSGFVVDTSELVQIEVA